MTTSAATDAVGVLIRTQTRRIDVTPSIGYAVRAPCLLRQLELAVRVGSERGRGGAAVAGSRPLIAVDAWDLWTDITTAAHMWADHLGVDRRPYRRQEVDALDRRPPAERAPAWMAALAGWLGPVAWDQRPEIVSGTDPCGDTDSAASSHQDGRPASSRTAVARRQGPGRRRAACRPTPPCCRGSGDCPRRGRDCRPDRALGGRLGGPDPRNARPTRRRRARVAHPRRHLPGVRRQQRRRRATRRRLSVPAIQVRLQPLPAGDDEYQVDADNLWPYRGVLGVWRERLAELHQRKPYVELRQEALMHFGDSAAFDHADAGGLDTRIAGVAASLSLSRF